MIKFFQNAKKLGKNYILPALSYYISEHSQFGYCPLVWTFHSKSLNNKINHLHERALQRADRNYDSSYKNLLKIDQSFTVHQRNIQP